MFTIHQGNRVLLLSSVLLLSVLGSALFFFLKEEKKPNLFYPVQTSSKNVEKKPLSLEGVALTLNKKRPDFEMVDISRVLEASVFPRRPKKNSQEICLCLDIAAQKKPQIGNLGQKLYLDLDEKKELHFSKDKTSFWVIPKKITESQVVLDVGVSLEGLSQESRLNHRVTLRPKAKDFLKPQDLKKIKKYKEFSEIAWLVPDQLQQLLHPEKELKHRLLIGSEILEISEGDLLLKESDQWKVVQEEIKSNSSLIRVVAIHDKSIDFEGWSFSDTAGISFKIPESVFVPLSISNENFIRNIRLKTHQQINCQIENQNLNIKVGDWILKNQGVWTILNTPKLVDRYLKHETEGLLFVFQSIGQLKGEKFLQGYLFDKLCSQKLHLKIPIQRKKPKQTAVKSSINTSIIKGPKR